MFLDQIWAPWRLAYVQGEHAAESKQKPAGSPFCFLCRAHESTDDRGNWIVARFPRSFVVLNRYPYNNGHLLIATNRHEGSWVSLTPEERQELAEVLSLSIELLQEVLRPEGYNVGLNLGQVAGAGLPGHLHWHLVPRWPGDTNFMPVTAGVKVIPQSLEALWTALREKLPGILSKYPIY
jgi:ATP adenylyltransferase